MLRGVSAEIDLDAALYNLEQLRQTTGGLPVIAVVKADAYGHGAPGMAGLYQRHGVYALAVAFVSEAHELREADITMPIIVLFDNTEIESFFDLRLTPVIHDPKSARLFSAHARKRNTVLDVHVKVDTGMGRVGFSSAQEVLEALAHGNLNPVGLMSHFSEADLADMEFIKSQTIRFRKIRDILHAQGHTPLCHMANSAATLGYPDSYMDAIRPGLALYGISPFEQPRPGMPKLKPVMTVKARILTLRRFGKGKPVSYARTFITKRETLVAVVAVGYADGYSRRLSNSAQVLINGHRAPVMGRVCMDLMMVDATESGDIKEQDEVVLMGAQGRQEITAQELAGKAATIPYEILTGLGCRGRRKYTGGMAGGP